MPTLPCTSFAEALCPQFVSDIIGTVQVFPAENTIWSNSPMTASSSRSRRAGKSQWRTDGRSYQ
jgi:hypothetical protein